MQRLAFHYNQPTALPISFGELAHCSTWSWTTASGKKIAREEYFPNVQLAEHQFGEASSGPGSPNIARNHVRQSRPGGAPELLRTHLRVTLSAASGMTLSGFARMTLSGLSEVTLSRLSGVTLSVRAFGEKPIGAIHAYLPVASYRLHAGGLK